MRRRTDRINVRLLPEESARYKLLMGRVFGVWTWTELVHKALHELYEASLLRHPELAEPGLLPIAAVNGGPTPIPAPTNAGNSAETNGRRRRQPLRAGIAPKAHTGKRVGKRAKKQEKKAKA